MFSNVRINSARNEFFTFFFHTSRHTSLSRCLAYFPRNVLSKTYEDRVIHCMKMYVEHDKLRFLFFTVGGNVLRFSMPLISLNIVFVFSFTVTESNVHFSVLFQTFTNIDPHGINNNNNNNFILDFHKTSSAHSANFSEALI